MSTAMFLFFCCFLLQSSVSFTWQIAVSVQNDSPNWITFAGHSRARNFNFGIDKERVEEGDGDSEVLQLNPICNVFILPYKLKYFFNCCPCCRVAERRESRVIRWINFSLIRADVMVYTAYKKGYRQHTAC